MEIQAAVTEKIEGKFVFQTLKLDEPKANEIQIQIKACGVCHTDAVARDLGLTPFPVVLGHEGSGVVEKLGPGVSDFEVGDHVVLSFAHCGNCENCLSGRPTVCLKFNELNFAGKMEDQTTRIHNGGGDVSNFFGQSSFSERVIVHSRNAVKVRKDVDINLLGPLGCGIQTGAGTVLNRLKPEASSSIAIFGCGAVGLSAVMAARIANCKTIIAFDVHESRLALAKELGATHAFNSKEVDVVEKVKALTDGGAHYSVETTGVPAVVKQSLNSLRPLGILAVVGVTPELTLNVQDELMAEGKSMIGVIEGDSVPRIFIPELIDYYRAGKFPFDKLVGFYDFENIEQAFEDSKNGKTIKPILKLSAGH